MPTRERFGNAPTLPILHGKSRNPSLGFAANIEGAAGPARAHDTRSTVFSAAHDDQFVFGAEHLQPQADSAQGVASRQSAAYNVGTCLEAPPPAPRPGRRHKSSRNTSIIAVHEKEAAQIIDTNNGSPYDTRSSSTTKLRCGTRVAGVRHSSARLIPTGVELAGASASSMSACRRFGQ